jgi:hypothetical protein
VPTRKEKTAFESTDPLIKRRSPNNLVLAIFVTCVWGLRDGDGRRPSS